MPRILVFQHIEVEHPGSFRDFLAADGVAWDAVELDAGEPIPDLSRYDGLWVMGGPMDTWEEDQYPWLVPEKAAIKEAVLDRRLPFLGVCLGHQLLAEALGGRVGPSASPEIGVLEVQATPAGERSPYLRGLPAVMSSLQWHGAEVESTPPNAEVLASTPTCRVQAMSVGARALSLQYHVEITPSTVTDWAEIPAYRASLERHLGPSALEAIRARAAAHMSELNCCARILYDNWMDVALRH